MLVKRMLEAFYFMKRKCPFRGKRDFDNMNQTLFKPGRPTGSNENDFGLQA